MSMEYGVGHRSAHWDGQPHGLGVEGQTLWTPRSEPNLFAWYDVLALDLDDGDDLSNAAGGWPDLSPNGNDLTTLTTPPNHPSYRLDDAGVPYVDFGGADPMGNTSTTAIDQPVTTFVVFWNPVETNDNGLVGFGSASGSDGIFMYHNAQNFYTCFAGNAAVQSRGFPFLMWGSFATIIDGADSAVWVEGQQVATGNAGGRNPDDKITIGAKPDPSDFSPGRLREVIVLAEAAPGAKVRFIQRWLHAKWGLYPFATGA